MTTNESDSNSPEVPKFIEPQEADSLYDETDRYFFKHRDKRVVTPSDQGSLDEIIETENIGGQFLRLKRNRPAYIDDPTRVADEAPLAMVDAEGKSTYHTPVELDVVDAESGTIIQRLSLIHSGPDYKGNEAPGYAVDLDREMDEHEDPDLAQTGGALKKSEFIDLMLRLQK